MFIHSKLKINRLQLIRAQQIKFQDYWTIEEMFFAMQIYHSFMKFGVGVKCLNPLINDIVNILLMEARRVWLS